jgi:murein L,D-transpeptidase YcbB/YkuD
MPFTRKLQLLICLIGALACSVTALADDSGISVAQHIEQMLYSEELAIDGIDILAEDILREAYGGHAFRPFWTSDENIDELMELIAAAGDHGLMPADYGQDSLQARLRERASDRTNSLRAAQLDLLLTEGLLRYGYHRRFGKVNGNTIDPNINFRREIFYRQAPTEVLLNALGSGSLAGFIKASAPSGTFYRLMQEQLIAHRAIAQKGGWPTVAEGPTLRAGDEDSRVKAIRARLDASGDLAPGAGLDSPLYDEAVEQAVKSFQNRHALDDDGVVGKQSITAMNVPVEARIDQIRLTLERMRWLTQEAAERVIVVNIAGFRLYFIEDRDIAWVTRAMVGKHYRQTPVFRGDIAYLEFNPTWTIPPTILRLDTLPAIKKDPGYLASKNIRVIDSDGRFVDPDSVDWNQYSRGVPYTLRQDPGPNNALGTVKFIFPNKHFVFLHDTPHPELFAHKQRAFSSGCIRVEDPLKLAELILDDPERYPRSELEAVVASKKTQRIHPSSKFPVVITYMTASIERDGKIRFLKDIYNRDAAVLSALNGPVQINVP